MARPNAAPPLISAVGCVRPHGAGCVVDVSVSPGAKRTECMGLHDGALRLRLAAPPVDGKANAHLVDWLSEQLACPKRDIRLLRGQTSRRKQLEVDLPPHQVQAWLEGLLADASGA